MEQAQAVSLRALLVQTRKRAELTQEELAERAGVSVNTISNLEAGRGYLPRQATLDLLVHALAAALTLDPPAEADLRAAFRMAADAGRAHRQGGEQDGGVTQPVAPTAPLLPAGLLTFLVCAPVPTTMAPDEYEGALRATFPALTMLLQRLVPARGGRLVDPPVVSDGAVCVFQRPGDAVLAACALQQALWEQHLPPASPPVCLALHTGWADPGAGHDYAGPSRRRAARLARLGSAGQLLLTNPTRESVRSILPEGVWLQDVGRQRLSVVERPQPLYQILQPLHPPFPPLRALRVPPTNLPVQLTSFIGREREQATAMLLLEQASLVTLVGAGGCGKTRLALAVAAEMLEQYADGAWLVELASLADPDLVVQAVASALGLREEPTRPLLATLSGYLQDRRLLLVLDNCEHMLPACAELAGTLLRRCPHLQLLATSRERLGIGGEVRYRVPSLTLPMPNQQPPPAVLDEYEGVRLFVERARASQLDFALSEENAAAVAQVCRQLDGLPLAIELAAAWVGSLPLPTIAGRLAESLGVLVSGASDASPRQRTLRATLDWSWALLGEPERVLLRRLATFASGWSVEAAERVCGGTILAGWPVARLLGNLVSKSLVGLYENAAPGRYGLLETVRQYAAERLAAAGEAEAVRDRHLDWCVALAEEAEPHLAGPDQGTWLGRLETEHDNLRAALGWARAQEDGTRALRLAGTLGRFWYMRSHFDEGRRWLEGALAGAEGADPALRAKALHGAGLLEAQQGRHGQAVALDEEALALYRALGDAQGAAATLDNLGRAAAEQGDYARAATLHEENLSLRRASGDARGVAISLGHLAGVVLDQGDYGRAVALYEESLAVFRELGDKYYLAATLGDLGLVVYQQGDYQRAAILHDESLTLSRELGDKRGIAASLNNLGMVAERRGEYTRAASLYEDCLALCRELGMKRGIAVALTNLGIVAFQVGAFGRAMALLEECVPFARDADAMDILTSVLESLAWSTEASGMPSRAARLGGAAEALRETLGMPLPPDQQDNHDRAAQALRAALGEEGFTVAWAKGRALAPEQAIAMALAHHRERTG